MKIWCSLSVLAWTAAIALGFPALQDAYKIPNVPSGSRTQYYVLHDDGTYKYGYDTSNGVYESATKMGGNVNGFFGFTDPEGKRVRLEYTAGGSEGFVPTLHVDKHSPVVAHQPAHKLQKISPILLKTADDEQFATRNDASYSFAYNTEDSSRTENSDADLNVKGSYTFIDLNGVRREVNYRAGSDTGFVVEADFLPKAPEHVVSHQAAVRYQHAGAHSIPHSPVPVHFQPHAPSIKTADHFSDISHDRNDASYRFSYATGESSRREQADSDLNVKGEYSFVADDGVERKVNYVAGSDTGFLAEGDHLPEAPEYEAHHQASVRSHQAGVQSGYRAPVVSFHSQPLAPTLKTADDHASGVSHDRNDASYSFSYDTSDSSRKEQADSDLNIQGEYSFVADDGIERKVNYVAGSDTGFLAKGDHLPKAPEQEVHHQASVRSHQAGVQSGYHAPVVSVHSQHLAPTLKTADDHASGVSHDRNDASYSFSYDTSDSSRREQADSDLNIQGEYSFVADDGIERKVNYVAGSDTGFLAEGDHLPKAPEHKVHHQASVRSHQAGVHSGHHSPVVSVHSQPLAPTLKTADDHASGVSHDRNDASYSFSYDTSDSSRKEQADSDLNVKGEYSFVADDGIERKVNYVAGSDTGFLAEGDHLPKAPEHKVHHQASVRSHQAGVQSGYHAPVVSVHSQPLAPTLKTSDDHASGVSHDRNDASYSFSYDTSDSSRKEQADSDLNVKGEFSFVADDGIERRVNYVAGSGTGFLAEGDHLPKAPESSGSQANLRTYQADAHQVHHTPVVHSRPLAPTLKTGEDHASGVSHDRKDASYSFSYDTRDSSRKEQADSDLNIQGEYSFVADDGIERKVNYVAGSDTGFLAEGDHLPKAPEHEVHHQASVRSHQAGVHSGHDAPVVSVHSQPLAPKLATWDDLDSGISLERKDASYSFSYDTSDSSRKEQADSNLNVQGEYSFVADDGIERKVNYVAGSDTGFLAEGDHLPKSPEHKVAHQASVRTHTPITHALPKPLLVEQPTPLVLNLSGNKLVGSSKKSHSEHQIGNVLVRQYSPSNRSKYGYVFTEI